MSKALVSDDQLGYLGYSTLWAQGRLGKDSTMAPQLHQSVATAAQSLVAGQIFESIAQLALCQGKDLCALMSPYTEIGDAFEAHLRPGGWWERVTKTYVALGAFADVQKIIFDDLDPQIRQLLEDKPTDFGNGSWARAAISEKVEVDTMLQGRLSMWGRRVYGNAVSSLHMNLSHLKSLKISQEQFLACEQAHAQRMQAAGLAA